MLTLLSLLAVGFALGMRHAMDADHVFAVATIVTRERSLAAAAAVGLLWGFGHSVTVFAVGAAILLMELVIPPWLGLALEFAVGIMLVTLGAIALWTASRSAHVGMHALPVSAVEAPHETHLVGVSTAALTSIAPALRKAVPPVGLQTRYRPHEAVTDPSHAHVHAHGDYMHTHVHRHGAQGHGHGENETPQGWLDRVFGRLSLYQALRPVLVGVLHGLAGSAGVALLVLAAVGNAAWGMAYLAVFGLGTTGGMMLITLLIAAPMAMGGTRSPALALTLKLAAGAMSLAFGLFLIYQIGFVQGLLVAGPV